MNRKDNILIDICVVILIILLIVLVIIAIVCTIRSQDKDKENKSQTMIKIDSQNGNYSDFEVYYDSETKVMYIINFHGGVSVMLNSDGTPRIYEDSDSE